MELREIARRFWLPMAMLAAVVAYGILGYTAIVRGATPLDGAYWTVLTLGGVGFHDTENSGPGAELFSISLIVALLVAVVVAVAIASDLAASGDLARTLRRRRMRKRIAALRDHFILCGYGRVGRAVAEEYRARGVPLIVIELDPRSAAELEEADAAPPDRRPPARRGARGGRHRRGPGAHRRRRLRRRQRVHRPERAHPQPRLTIVARASDPESVSKLTRVGADSVVSPYTLSGQRMALDSLAAHEVSGSLASDGAAA